MQESADLGATFLRILGEAEDTGCELVAQVAVGEAMQGLLAAHPDREELRASTESPIEALIKAHVVKCAGGLGRSACEYPSVSPDSRRHASVLLRTRGRYVAVPFSRSGAPGDRRERGRLFRG